MEPLSIATASLQLVQTLYRVSESIYSFIQATRSIDQTVQTLLSQVHGLTEVLKALSTTLDRPILGEVARDNHELWKNVGDSVESCRCTVDELREKLDSVKTPKTHLKQVWRQVKLDMKQGDIDRILSAIKTHSVNLQLSMGIVNVLVCAASPDLIIRDQALRFEKLERMIIAIDNRLEPRDSLPPAPVDEYISTVTLDETTAGLRRSADSVMSMASTVTPLSVIGDTKPLSSLPNEPAFDYFTPASGEDPHVFESTTGSEFGIPLENSRRVQIQDWIQQSPYSDELSEESSITKTRTLSSVFSETSAELETNATEAISEIFAESSDEDIDFQVMQSLFSKGEVKLKNRQYAEAETLIRHGLAESQHSSAKKREALKIDDMRLKLATCCLYEGKLGEAEELFLSIAREPIRDTNDAKRVFQAIHNLASLHLQKRNFEAAVTHCRQALQGRRKTRSIGKTHSDYFASLRLLALILWAKGDKIHAGVYADLLPQDKKIETSEFDSILEKEFELAVKPSETSPANTLETPLKLSAESLPDTRKELQHSPPVPIITHSAGDYTGPQHKFKDGTTLTFKWPYDAREVFVIGLFNQNPRKTQLNKVNGIYQASVQIENGVEKVLYRFDVDGCSTVDNHAPIEYVARQKYNVLTPKDIMRSAPMTLDLSTLPSLIPQAAGDSADQIHSKSAKDEKISRFQEVPLAKDYATIARGDAMEANVEHDKKDPELQTAKRISEANAEETFTDAEKITNAVTEASPWRKAQTSDESYTNVVAESTPTETNASNPDVGGAQSPEPTSPRSPGKSRDPDEALLRAASTGDVSLVRILVQGGVLGLRAKPNVNAVTKDDYAKTPLIVAAEKGWFEVCTILLSAHADVNAQDSRGRTALMMAANSGSTEICETLISCGGLLEKRDLEGVTALMLASSRGHGNICRLLLKSGADKSLCNNEGVDAYNMAPNEDIRTILSTQANPGRGQKRNYAGVAHAITEFAFSDVSSHTTKKDLWIVIHDKVYNISSFVDEHPGGEEVMLAAGGQDATKVFEEIGHSDEAREILSSLLVGQLNKQPANPTDLHRIETHQKPSAERATKQNIPDPRVEARYKNTEDAFRHSSREQPSYDRPPPHFSESSLNLTSTDEDKVAAGNIIQKHGFHKTGKANKGLIWAAQNNQFHVIQLLLKESDINVNVLEKSFLGNDDTPLIIAAAEGFIEICVALLNAHAKVDGENYWGVTALEMAAIRNHTRVCQLLLRHGANVEGGHKINKRSSAVTETKITTPLARAAYNGNTMLCVLFLSNGAKVDGLSKGMRTPLMKAAKMGRTEACQLLLSNGANANALDESNNTALMLAAEAGAAKSVCKLLVENRALILCRNDKGKSAIDLAKNKSIKDFLLEHSKAER